MEKVYTMDLAGSQLKVTIGKVAEQANGACLVQYGETVVLVTATSSSKPREGIDFFPLSVDYEEKMYAVGKIPGGFIKREGRPSEKATLSARLIDRPLRPLFPEGYRNDVHIVATVLSVDQDHSPEIASMIGSSIALCISDIPFDGPTGSVEVGFIDGKYVINPSEEERNKSLINLSLSGTESAIMMVEAGAQEVSESEMLEAILEGHEVIKEICSFIKEITNDIGKEKSDYEVFKADEEIVSKVKEYGQELLIDAIRQKDKVVRVEKTNAAKENIREHFKDLMEENANDIEAALEEIEVTEVRRGILEDERRPDDRKLTEIRPLSSEVGILPRTHGSGLFTRGQTQVLSIATLGAISEEQVIDGLGDDKPKRYIHHYNFPGFCVGDTKPSRSPGRREIGHGALAERALIPVIPDSETFPYTIRVVSEVLSSNGSSSQASICGSTLALMDAGVPIKAPVAGIAMGLIEENEIIKILTDIQGLEDHFGDMDFKVAGTRKGITAIQMDIKVEGIKKEILEVALERAKVARFEILDHIATTIEKPREELSKYAPIIHMISIDPERIGEVIGVGGKIINKIIEQTGVKIDIDDDGRISILSDDDDKAKEAISIIEDIVKDIEVGEVYTGKVKKIVKFGAFVEIKKGTEGLLHISEIAHERTKNVEDVLKVGDTVEVKVIDISDETGKISLSRKAILKREDSKEEQDK
ncbi:MULTISPECIES: polyribonucleotide nucleotidyltransferase [Peptoniphilus]|uniref:polyribonucleotide nucleotidyltransferase n=1 Tax=Peptoniphilus TaxID=162289 RepID=UPI000287D529|nr:MULTISPECIES: polyribonucleotide nucleotidyltransferase [Peptoniphilus]MBS6609994.1 polyribonucleotide nucleotidyltransferase [Peptoniphilus harei]MDU5376857.1 polyribonucleotide nucleotidyltransferase [Peptoniphilus lacydonensis]MDU5436430.1 polyribonucleotide nucleotidyltransferase [Peptoniphilus lacydonensis]